MKKLYLASLLALASFSGAYGILGSIGRSLDQAAGQVGLGRSVRAVKQAPIHRQGSPLKMSKIQAQFLKLKTENQVLKKANQELRRLINMLKSQLKKLR